MKKNILFVLFIVSSLCSYAQHLPENFNASCLTAPEPIYWIIYNALTTPTVSAGGSWVCAPTQGRPATVGGGATPGVRCSGAYSSTYHLDTSYLISPVLNLTSTEYPGGHVFLRFDSRRESIVYGGRLAVVHSFDSTGITPAAITIYDTSGLITPVLDDDDTSGWITHEIDLSGNINAGPFCVAFRYTSTPAAGTAWYLDNISLTTSTLRVTENKPEKGKIPIAIVGTSTSNHVALSYTAPAVGNYHIALYDMIGRQVYDGDITANPGTALYNITGLSLHAGMYCVKMGDTHSYGTAKLVIE